jgi:hypothetical protein
LAEIAVVTSTYDAIDRPPFEVHVIRCTENEMFFRASDDPSAESQVRFPARSAARFQPSAALLKGRRRTILATP